MNAKPAPLPVVALRPIRDHDLPAIADIEARSYEFPWSQGIFNDCLRAGYCAWTLTMGTQVVGYGMLSVMIDEAHLLNLCIDPDHRRHGHAHVLLEHLMKISRDHGVLIMFLEVRPSNAGAIKLYEDAGFHRVAVRRNYYPAREGREDAVVMSLRFEPAAARSAVESPVDPG